MCVHKYVYKMKYTHTNTHNLFILQGGHGGKEDIGWFKSLLNERIFVGKK